MGRRSADLDIAAAQLAGTVAQIVVQRESEFHVRLAGSTIFGELQLFSFQFALNVRALAVGFQGRLEADKAAMAGALCRMPVPARSSLSTSKEAVKGLAAASTGSSGPGLPSSLMAPPPATWWRR